MWKININRTLALIVIQLVHRLQITQITFVQYFSSWETKLPAD